MSSVRFRAGMLASFALVGALILSGCGTGRNAQTSQAYAAAVGTNDRGGPIELHNALFVVNSLETATLSVVLINKTDSTQKLVGVSVKDDDGGSLEATLAEPITLAPRVAHTVGKKGEVIVTGDSIKPGYFVSVTFDFDSAASITVDAPLVERTSIYAEVAEPTPSPSPGPSPSPAP